MRVSGWKVAGVALLCGVMVGAVVPVGRSAVAKQKYETYKTRVMAGDLAVDWRAFRLAAMVGGVDGGFDWHPVRNQVLQDADADKDDAALAGRTRLSRATWRTRGPLLAMLVLRRMGRRCGGQGARDRGCERAVDPGVGRWKVGEDGVVYGGPARSTS